LFLLYLVYLPVSLFALITACFRSILATGWSAYLSISQAADRHFSDHRRLFRLCLADHHPRSHVIQGTVPEGIDSFATEVTYFLDLGLIAPTAFLAAIYLFRRQPVGYLLAALILTLNAMIGPVAFSQGIMQSLAGVEVSTGEQVVFVGIFILTSLFAAGLLVTLLRSIESQPAHG
jgi:hypothetical protein